MFPGKNGLKHFNLGLQCSVRNRSGLTPTETILKVKTKSQNIASQDQYDLAHHYLLGDFYLSCVLASVLACLVSNTSCELTIDQGFACRFCENI